MNRLPHNLPMKTAYFTFGQSHVHRINGKTFDCDCVVRITAEDPSQVMHDTFGPKWAFQYSSPPPKLEQYYPRGIIDL